MEEAACELFRQGGSVSDGEMSYCISQRVREKKESYERYGFERSQEEALSTFFDLAQEFTAIDSLYQICASVARQFLNLESRIYIIEPKSSQLDLVCTSREGLVAPGDRARHQAVVVEEPTEAGESWFFPIRGNKSLVDTLPFLGHRYILGVFEVHPKDRVDERNHFFLEKFTNRIGYNLHQKLLVQQNINHIKFINQLVSDIEHNVITPNMYYKLFLVRLRKIIENYRAVEDLVERGGAGEAGANVAGPVSGAAERLHAANHELQNEISALSSHYEHNSLFLETLMRKDHFQKGTYVLRKQSCNFHKEIIRPLIDRYSAHFARKSVAVEDGIEKDPSEQVALFVDKGLISQVFDNFFSNALKYAGEAREGGRPGRLFSMNRRIVENAFAEGKPGVRFEFFTSGKPLGREESDRVFDEGYRAGGSPEEGKGHGLHFVKNVVEVHGGRVGCEPQAGGNLFYLLLPVEK